MGGWGRLFTLQQFLMCIQFSVIKQLSSLTSITKTVLKGHFTLRAVTSEWKKLRWTVLGQIWHFTGYPFPTAHYAMKYFKMKKCTLFFLKKEISQIYWEWKMSFWRKDLVLKHEWDDILLLICVIVFIYKIILPSVLWDLCKSFWFQQMSKACWEKL